MNIPSAKEFITERAGIEIKNFRLSLTHDEFAKLMIEFTRLHVEAAINTIYDNGFDAATEWDGNPYTGEGSEYLSLDKLKKSYPLENIK